MSFHRVGANLQGGHGNHSRWLSQRHVPAGVRPGRFPGSANRPRLDKLKSVSNAERAVSPRLGDDGATPSPYSPLLSIARTSFSCWRPNFWMTCRICLRGPGTACPHSGCRASASHPQSGKTSGLYQRSDCFTDAALGDPASVVLRFGHGPHGID